MIGIIALLISILLPSLSRARQSAEQVACASNLRQFGFGFQMYCDQSKGTMPQKGPDGSDTGTNNFSNAPGTSGLAVDDPSLWFNAAPMMIGRKSYYQMLLDDQAGGAPAPTSGKSSVFVCPSATGAGTLDTADDKLTADGQYFLLNGTDSQGLLHTPTTGKFKFNMSYVMNASLTNTIGDTQVSYPLKYGQLNPSSAVVLVVEKLVTPGEFQDAGVQKFNASNPTAFNGSITPAGFTDNIAQPKSNWKRASTRHHGGANVLFADGHVSWYAWRDIQIQPNQLPVTATTDANQYSRMIWSVRGPIH